MNAQNLFPPGFDLAGRAFRVFSLGLAVMASLVWPALGGGAGRQVLHGHVPAAAKRLTPVGRPEPKQRLRLAIGLPLRNQAVLARTLKELYDPANPSFHKYLTPAEFTERFGPRENDYQAVVAFARAHGLTVTNVHPNRVILDVEGEIGAVEKAFQVKIRTYRHPTEARTFYAPDREPSLDLATPILHISGLDNYAISRPLFKPRPSLAKSGGAPDRALTASPNVGSGPSGGYMGSDFRAAYVPGVSLAGSGETVGLLEMDGYTTSDITYYEGLAGLPNVKLTNVLIDGVSGLPSGDGGEVEVSLDIEMVISIAPSVANVIVYEAPVDSWHDLLNRIATDNLAKQIGCSWYLPGGTADPVADQIFQQMASQGQSFFAASGDSDAYTGLIPFPGDTPYITEVGGTTLTTNTSGGPWSSETVWNWGGGQGSSGGISTQYAIPTWQQGISMSSNQGSTTMRNSPDVALTADNVYVRADGEDQNVGGTSCAAPLWAGFIALVNQQALTQGGTTVGFVNPAVYAIGKGSGYTAAFHDTSTGNNFSPSSPSKFAAAVGYDLCTGWGTPLGAGLINALAGPVDNLQVTGLDLTANGPIGGSFTPAGTTYTLKNAGSASLNWTANASQPWVTLSQSSGSLAAGASIPVTVNFNSAAAALAVGIYTGAVTFTDVTSGVNEPHTVSLTVNPHLAISPASLPAATATAPYNQTATVSGGTVPYATVSISSFSGGATGLTAAAVTTNATTGTVYIGGTPSAAGTASFNVNVTDGAGGTLTQPYTIAVNPALAIAPAALSSGTISTAYNQLLTVTGGTIPFTTFSVTSFSGGTTGLTASAITTSSATGTISINGTPTAVGTASFTVNVTDSAGATLTASYTITIFGNGPPAPQIDVEQPARTILTSGVSTVSFASLGVGVGVKQTFTIRNEGNATLTISGLTFTGANSGDFTLTTAPASTLASLASTTFVVTYSPSFTSAETAALNIASNDPTTGVFTVPLSGSILTGIAFGTGQAAQTVVGQLNFTTQSTTESQTITPGPSGCALSSTGVLAICDQAADRVLLWNSIPTTNGQPANVVVGKASFTDTSVGPTASLIGRCNGVAFSPSGQLLVVDSDNSRVLVWNTIPTTNGAAANVVIGQAGFTTGTAGVSATQLNDPSGVFVSPAGQLLIADYENNRVLIYNSIPTANGAAANLVIGQSAMTGSSSGSGANQLYSPWGMAMTPSGELLIADVNNNRVLVFNSVPTSSGASANLVIGQTAFGVSSSGTTASTLEYPVGVAVSPTGQVAIPDFANNRVLIYNSVPTSNGAAANVVLGQTNFITGTAFNGGINASSMSSAYQPAFSPTGALLVPGRDMSRLMIFSQAGSSGAPIISSAASAGATVGRAFSYQITASNSPTSYTATGLPVTLSVNMTTGFISGTPSVAGTYSVSLSASNGVGTGTATLNLTVHPSLSITPASLPTVVENTAYAQVLTVTGGTAPYTTFSVTNFNGGTTGLTAGAIVANATAGTFTIGGTPSGAGTASFTVNIVDSVGAALSQSYALNVQPALAGLSLSSGSLTPAFSSGTTIYTAAVSSSTASIAVTPTAADATSTITVNGVAVASGAASAPIALNSGPNVITTVITAQNGATSQTYSVTVYQGPLVAAYSSASSVPLTVSNLAATGIPITFSLGYAPTTGTVLTVVNNTGLGFINGVFSNLAQGQAVALIYDGITYNFVANYYGGTGNDLVLQWAGVQPVAWGYNQYGQLGNGTLTNSLAPGVVITTGALAGKTLLAVAVGGEHTLALCSDGTLAAWGYNNYGELGNNTFINSSVPVAVTTAGTPLAGRTVIAIAAGANHSLALCSDGTVAAWGYNVDGELGNGSTLGSGEPVAVTTAGTALAGKSVIAIAAGQYHSIVECSDGTLVAWGANADGQLGNNGTVSVSLATLVTTAGTPLAGKTVTAIVAGGYHNLALCSDGTLAGWGYNVYGQLGNNSSTNALVPVAVTTAGTLLAGKAVATMAAGAYHTLALCTDGTLAAWGYNVAGQLGNGSLVNSLVPAAVTTAGTPLSSRTAVTVAAGYYHSMVRCSDGTAAAWGSNTDGQLGNGTTTNVSVPTAVSSLPTGDVFVTGATGPLASHCLGISAVPLPVPIVTTLAASPTSTGAVLNGLVNPNGGSAAISFDYGGTVSYGTNVPGAPSPVTGSSNTAVSAVVSGLTLGATYHFRVDAVNASGPSTGGDVSFTTATNNASLYNLAPSAGALGPAFSSGVSNYTVSVSSATNAITFTPTTTDGNATVTVNGVAVASGTASLPIALSSGANTVNIIVTAPDGVTTQTYSVIVLQGPLIAAYDSPSDVPLTVPNFTATGATVTLSLNFAPATGTSLTIVNNTGLGFINGAFSNLAQGQVVALTYNGTTYNFVANYYGGSGNDLVLQWTGTQAFAWGYNVYGQLGNGGLNNDPLPAPVLMSGALSGKTVLALAAGGGHSLALCSDGTLVSWGYNIYGQLGNGGMVNSSVPVAVTTTGTTLAGKTVVAIAAGESHSLALCSDGTLAAWGYNYDGELGDNNTINSNVPVAVVTAGTPLAGKTVVGISALDASNLVICSDGTLASWGSNVYGELGNGGTIGSSVPVAVTTSGTPLAGKTVIAVCGGGYHCLALCADGTLAGWGYNVYGQLGNNSTANSLVPVAVTTAGTSLAGKTVVALAAGIYHSLALCTDGTVAGWGYNSYGQLGNGLLMNSLLPAAVTTAGTPLANRTVVAVAGGSYYSIALCSDGTEAVWGQNNEGQFGNGTTTNSSVPAPVSSLPAGDVFVSATNGSLAFHTMGIVAAPVPAPVVTTLAATAITSTGANLNGLVNPRGGSAAVSFDFGGTSSYGTTVAGAPSPVTGGATTAVSAVVSGLSLGATYHFRVDAANAIGPASGGDVTFTTVNNNASLSALAPSAGTLSPAFSSSIASYTVGVSSATNTVAFTPTTTDGNATVTVNGVGVASGTACSPIALTPGPNTVNIVVTAPDGVTTQTYSVLVLQGTLAAVFNSPASVPLSVGAFTATGLAVSFSLNFAPATGTALTVVNNTGLGFINGAFSNLAQGQAVALTYNGTTYSFVANYYGGPGNNLVLQWAGAQAFLWGYNGYGQLGNNSTNNGLTPSAVLTTGVLSGKTLLAVAAGGDHSLALCSDGTLAAWGYNADGQLGNNSTTESNLPVAVTTSGTPLAGKTVIAIAAGTSHSLALCSDGTLAAWGYNNDGQLGNNSTNQSNVPVAVTTAGTPLAGKTVVRISALADSNLVECSDGTLAAWGYNSYGQLGNNSTTNSLVAVAVITAGTPLAGKTVIALGGGGYHCLALCTDGALAGWGLNFDGQLGNNSMTNSLVPGAVTTAGTPLAGKTIAAVAAGGEHSLALCTDGTLAGWGYNAYGQLGNASTLNSLLPVAITTAGTPLASRTVVAVAAGYYHSIAQCSDGSAVAWGENNDGQVGNNTTTNSSLPTAVSPLPYGDVFVTTISGSSAAHSMGIAAVPVPAPVVTTLAATTITSTGATLNGLVNANGGSAVVSFDYGGTASYGTNVAGAPSPVTGSSSTAVSAVVSGLSLGVNYHFRVDAANAIGPASGGDVTFTTANNNASLSALSPSAGTLSPAFSSSIASYTVGVSSATNTIAFTPTTTDGNATVTVNGIGVASGTASGPINLTPGSNTINIVVTAPDGVTTQTYSVLVLQGMLAATFNSAASIPLSVSSFTASGLSVTFSLNFAPATGTALTVVNNSGLGFINGVFSNLTQGQAVALTYNGITYDFVANYYGGNGNDLVLQWAGAQAFAWGENLFGQLGNNTTTNSSVPVAVVATGALAGKTLLSVAAGGDHNLALCSDGTLVSWGYNIYGQLGNSSTNESTVPVAVTTAGTPLAGKTVVAIAAGCYHSVALCSDGTLAAWGYNNYGQLGNNSTVNSSVPVAVTAAGTPLVGKTVVAMAVGAYHCLVECSDGTLAAWGYNTYGQLGNNSVINSSVPVAVTTIGTPLAGKTVVAVSAGAYHTFALCSDGSPAVWGYNASGQLGNNSTLNSLVPAAMTIAGSSLAGKTITGLSGGYGQSLALCSDGTLSGWGDNSDGELGNGTTTNSLIPVAVTTAGTALANKTATSAAAGAYHCVVQCSDGTLAAWGYNNYGQLGNNGTVNSSLPVAVSASSLAPGEVFAAAATGSLSYHCVGIAAVTLPSITTLAATSVTSSGATLNGTVNANGASTAVSFDYGPTTAYGVNVAGAPAQVTGSSSTAVSVSLAGLSPSTTYHFRVDGGSSAGSLTGGDLTFTTLAIPPTLSNFTLSAGTLSPSFSSGTTSYSASVNYSVASVTVTPTVTAPTSTVKVNGNAVASGAASGPIILGVGANTINIVLTAQDGVTTNSYTVVVTRAVPSTNAALAGLAPSAGSLAPVFASGITSYTVNVPIATPTISFIPTTADPTATVKVNGVSVASGSASGPISLSPGANTINTVVTAQDGVTAQTYSVLVLQGPLPAAFTSASYVPLTVSGFTATGASVSLSLGFAPATGASLTIVNNTGLGFINGAFSNLAQGQAVTMSYNGVTYTFVANYYGGTGNDLVLQWAGVEPYDWGYNADGQLGNNSTTNGLVPVGVLTSGALAGKTLLAVAAGELHTLALCSDGTMAAWGYNGSGQLGNNSTANSSVPVAVTTAGTPLSGRTVIAISAGAYHSLALCSDGTLVAWGLNSYGELGNNSTNQSIVPVAVTTTGTPLAGKSVVAIAAGGYHSVVECSDGSLAAWGDNNEGQLGNNTTTNSSVAVAVTVTGSALAGKLVTALVAGDAHNLAVCSDGSLAAWGWNANGQLGINATSNSLVPIAVLTTGTPLAGKTIVAAAGGTYHSLALCSDGTLASWGYNINGELGNGTSTSSLTATAVTVAGTPLSGRTVASLAAGFYHSVVRCSDGTVAAWGSNSAGQLGNNSTTNNLVPVAVASSSLAAGDVFVTGATGSVSEHSLALVAAPPPLPAPTVTTLAATSVGGTVATVNGAVNGNGNSTAVSFDYGLTTSYGANVAAMPTPVTGATVAAVSASLSGLIPASTYHFRVDGVSSSGASYGGDLTFSTPNNNASLAGLALSAGSLSPAFSNSITSYTALVSSATTSIALTPTTADPNAVVAVNGVSVASGSASGPISLVPGANTINTVVTAQDGVTTETYSVVVLCGPLLAAFNSAASVPLTASSFTATGATVTLSLNFTPATGTALTVVNNIGIGLINGVFGNLAQGQSVALSYNGFTYNFVANYYGGSGNDLVLQWAAVQPFAWGLNVHGQLGNNSTADNLVPGAVLTSGPLSGKTLLAVAAGGEHSLALCSDGTLAAWGDNAYGELGNGSTNSSSVPVAVSTTGAALAGRTVVAIAAGTYHNLVLCLDGTLVTWGYNNSGQLGIGNSTSSNVPVAVTTTGTPLAGRSVAAIAAGGYFNIVECSDGTLIAWGGGVDGQLGDKSTANSLTPTLVTTTGTALAGRTVTAFAAGGDHVLALCSDGSLAAWGYNIYGQLGIGSTTNSSVPVAVTSAGTALAGKTVVGVAAGLYHSLALCADGALVAWGYNGYGQLGNGTTTNSKTAIAVTSGGTPLAGRAIAVVAAGAFQSMVQCSDGTVAAWGYNGDGELGNTTTTNSNVPAALNVSSLPMSGVLATAATGSVAYHSLGLVAVPEVAPTVATLAASSVTSTGAILNGTVNANGSNTAVSFDYGASTSYGTNVPGAPTPVNGNAATAVSAVLSGLTPGATYHFRVDGVSGAGESDGADLTFTTISTNATLSNLTLSVGSLSPSFASGTTSYTATVPYGATSITVTPTLADLTASVQVNGVAVASGSASGPITLNVGANTITTLVTAQDGVTTVSYTTTVTVLNAPPSNLTYAANPVAYTIGVAIASNPPSSAGGPVASYTVSPPLPSGLSLDPFLGIISGTPTAITPSASYTVTAANNGGAAAVSVILAVNDVPPSALVYGANPVNYPVDALIPLNMPTYSGGIVVSFSVSPPLPVGLRLDPVVGVISGTPTALAPAANYTITATNSGGSTSAVLSLMVSLTVQSWRQIWFGTAVGSGDTSDLGDFDHNGIPNLVKYAFGLNPTMPSAMQLPPAVLSGGTCGFNFTEPAGVTGITYGAEYSSDLTGGVWSSIPDSGSGPNHVFSMPIAGYGKLFLRLTVTEQ